MVLLLQTGGDLSPLNSIKLQPLIDSVFRADKAQADKKGNNWKGEQRANRLIQKLCERAEVEAFGYHDIRHTVAKYLNDLQKVGLKKVQQVLRHKRQMTTEIYVEGNYTDTGEAVKLLEIKKSKISSKNPAKP